MKKNIYPCLWFDGSAKAAADFYCSVFNRSKIVDERHASSLSENEKI